MNIKKLLKRLKSKKKILIIVGGNINKISEFGEAAKKLGLDVTLASFSDLTYESGGKYQLKVGERDVAYFDVIYIRMVGKRLEDVSLLALYAKKHGVRLIDHLYENESLMPSSISKALETKKLVAKGISMPKTYYGDVSRVSLRAKKALGFPFVIKSTSGRKAREVWVVDDEAKYKELLPELVKMEKGGMRFFAQQFAMASQRERVLVIGGKALGAITRPTKWRKRVKSQKMTDNPEGVRGAISPIPDEYKKLAIAATKAVDLDIAGVDVLRDDNTGRLMVIEVNAAPAWKLIHKDCGICVEEEVLKFISK